MALTLLIKLADFLAEPITHIVNLCFTQGVWSNALKVAEIVPVHKSKEKNDPSN